MATRKKADGIHNAHLLIPEELWVKLRKYAKKHGVSITDCIVSAATLYLAVKVPKPEEES